MHAHAEPASHRQRQEAHPPAPPRPASMPTEPLLPTCTGHIRIDCCEVQDGVCRLLAQDQRQLGNAYNASCRLCMAHERLGCGEVQRGAAGQASLEQHSCCCPHFNGVAQRGASAVHLQVSNLPGGQVAAAQSSVHRLLLAWPVGGRQAAAPPVLVHRAARQKSQGLPCHRRAFRPSSPCTGDGILGAVSNPDHEQQLLRTAEARGSVAAGAGTGSTAPAAAAHLQQQLLPGRDRGRRLPLLPPRGAVPGFWLAGQSGAPGQASQRRQPQPAHSHLQAGSRTEGAHMAVGSVGSAGSAGSAGSVGSAHTNLVSMQQGMHVTCRPHDQRLPHATAGALNLPPPSL